MNGAEILVETMLASGVNVCFANPGTSEMHFVAALDTHPDMRCILCLFEGGVTGAADGYARMSGNVAGTLLHLAPGFANGWANMHNARKGQSGMVNVVGDHAAYHLKHDAPLQADLDGVARSVSQWVARAEDPGQIATIGAEAIRAARGGQIATIILPTDTAWSEGDGAPVTAAAPRKKHLPQDIRLHAAAEALKKPGAALLVGGAGLYGASAETAGRIAARSGARLLASFFSPRIEMGDGTVKFDQMPYHADANAEFLKSVTHIVCLGDVPPVNFFAYPGKPSTPEPPGCVIDRLAYPDWDVPGALDALAAHLGVDGSETIQRVEGRLPDLEDGPLTPDGIGRALARETPEGAIIVNEAVSAGAAIWPHVDFAARHDRVKNTGGSIGHGLPAALGCAVACPDRPVITVTGDG